MKINSDLNILGGLPDWNLINVFLNENTDQTQSGRSIHSFTKIKTDKSVKRFEKAILSTLIHFKDQNMESLIRSVLSGENITNDSLYLLFWNASSNNELLHYLNKQVFMIAFYSGRISIKLDEVIACLKDLREREVDLRKWSDSTLEITASKYLTLLKKFNLMEGTQKKSIVHPYLSDKMFVLFVYWLSLVEAKPNVLESEWINYSFCEKAVFIERIMQKRFSKFFQITYTGDSLKIETTIPYSEIYYATS